jgi:hypothetical protein
MKKRIRLTVVSMVLLLFAYGLGYWTGASRTPRGAQIIFARDSDDMPPVVVDSLHSIYDPSFAKQNAVPNKVR